MVNEPRGMDQVLRDIGRVMGGIEELKSTVQEVKVNAIARDDKLAQLSEQVRDNNHHAANTAQKAVAQIESVKRDTSHIQAKVEVVASDIKAMDVRVAALEVPVQRALRSREERRKLLIRVSSAGTALVVLLWALLSPAWNLLVETVWKKWIGGH